MSLDEEDEIIGVGNQLEVLIEISTQLTTSDCLRIRNDIGLPEALCENSTEGLDFLSCIRNWTDHDPFLLYLVFENIRPDLIAMACEIPWLCVSSLIEEAELSIKSLINLLESELTNKQWKIINFMRGIKMGKDVELEITLNKLLETGFIERDLNQLSKILREIERDDVVDKLIAYQDIFSKMEDGEFKRKFRKEVDAHAKDSKKWDEKNYIQINHEKFKSVYNQKNNSKGLGLFILFNASKNTTSQANTICQQIAKCLSNFGFIISFIRTTNDTVNPMEYFYAKLDEVIQMMWTEPCTCLIAFIIGEIVPVKYSDGTLSYYIGSPNESANYISQKDISALIYHRLSQRSYAVPAIVLCSYISPNNAILTKDINICFNTFFCYASSSTRSLPKEANSHQIVYSIFKVLENSKEEHLLLTEFFTEIRDDYFNYFPAHDKNSYNIDTRFYSKNTLRYPLLVKYTESLSKTDSVRKSLGFFFFIYSSTFMESNWTNTQLLMEKLKKMFESINYMIGEDVILMNEQSYSNLLTKNATLCKGCRFVFIIVLNRSTSHKVMFEDRNEIDVDIFLREISTTFANLPKVIYLSHLFETQNISSSEEKEHMLIVHSIEPFLSKNSLINNFASEIKRNYFSELHSLLRSAIIHTTQSFSIQIVDGLRKNFYINYHGHLAQLLNKEDDEFKSHYEKACNEGTESFKFFRLMVVGPEGVGKTSLLRVLTGLCYQEEEKSTKLLEKYDVQIQKFSHDWANIEDLDTYIRNLEETRQDLAIKLVAQMIFHSEYSANTQSINVDIALAQTFPSQPTDSDNSDIIRQNTTTGNTLIEKSSDQGTSDHQIEVNKFEKISSTLDRIQSLRCKSDFFTAWDFAGQNYLYCFHSLFLSPRSVYLLLVDLSIKDLKNNIEPRHREDRYDQRSKSGVPTTYLEVFEFWFNAIYSISKTQLTDSYKHYTATKIIIVFSKADEVEKPEEIANKYYTFLKSHMSARNNSFSLVHEDDGIFIISCKTDSPYYQNILKLKSAIKRVSDEVAFEEPIPIKWLKLANDILRDDKPILDRSRIQYLAEYSKCTDELQYFLHFFNDIGFFFFKQDNIIVNIKKFLSLIYYILFPQMVEKSDTVFKDDIKTSTDEGRLSFRLFEYLLDYLNLSNLREPLLDLLQIYGIIIKCELETGFSCFYVPYLLSGSLVNLRKKVSFHKVFSEHLIYFPDRFLPVSLYFTLLAKCLNRNKGKRLPKSLLGFDCAIFYVCKSLIVSIDCIPNNSLILVNFFTIDSSIFQEEYIISEVINYLIFLQLFLVEIQSTLIPCGNLAKISFVCNSCKTLELLEMGIKPQCCLDTILSIDESEVSKLKQRNQVTLNGDEISSSKFCCTNQFTECMKFILSEDAFFHHICKSYVNTELGAFIINHRHEFVPHLNWRILSNYLYSLGLFNMQRIAIILIEDILNASKSEMFLMEMIHKGPQWAIKFYFALCNTSNEPGHRYLRSFLDQNINSYRKNVIKTDNPERNAMNFFYPMNKNRHGIAFIVNIECYRGNYEDRLGSKLDIDALRRVFDFLQYESRVYEDLTRLEYIRTQRAIRDLDHSQYDSYFCVIMAHGNENEEVVFSDEAPLSKAKIVSEFSPKYCKGLASKPRIFLFQVCRGKESQKVELKKIKSNLDKNLFVDYLDNPPSTDGFNTGNFQNVTRHNKPIFESALCSPIDTYIADSTINQYASYRDTSIGTFFIQSFCSVMQSCNNLEFTYIMMEVRRKVCLFSQKYQQCTEDTNHLQGPVYFF